jgi:D-xylose 1-dehydrogenase (NADP+, D-xylono-1,5-lactone-forming)
VLNWGFLGASRIGRRSLAPAVLAAEGHALRAVAARDAVRAQEFAAAFSAPLAYGGYQALIDDPAIDLVYNALPNDAHLPWTIRALEAGKHVLCEKPLALSAAEVAEIMEVSQRTGRLVLEAFSYRFHPQVDRVRELLATGKIGRIVALHASFTATMPPEDFRWQKALGGGALYDVGCYCVSILRLAAEREPVQAAAVASLRGDVDATLAGLLDFGAGLAGHFSCSFTAPFSQHLAIIGESSAISLERPFTNKDRVVTLMRDGVAEEFAAMDPYRRMVEHFGRAARGEETLRFSLEEALRQARTMDGLFRAAASGKVEKI